MSEAAYEAVSALTDAQAKMEAARCLMCDDPPCVAATGEVSHERENARRPARVHIAETAVPQGF